MGGNIYIFLSFLFRKKKSLANACKTNNNVNWFRNVLGCKAYEQQAGGASTHKGTEPLTSMIYEAEKPGTENVEGKHAVTVIQTRWYATCCFCNTGNYPQGGFLKEYNLALMPYWRGRQRMAEMREGRKETEVQVEGWVRVLQEPSCSGNKGHPGVRKRQPAK